MPNAEIQLIRALTGVGEGQIRLHDDGFMSRGYVIDGGRLVFKFKKRPDVSYVQEARTLDALARQDLGVRLQRVAFPPEEDSYLGLWGVPGVSLEGCALDDASRAAVSRQLGEFLRRLHSLTPQPAPVYPLKALIQAWQARYQRAMGTLAAHFGPEELAAIDRLMTREMPDTLRRLGEKRVFSHGDLGDGNVLVDGGGQVGVIDFNGSGYMDEASDFMDIGDDALCAAMLDAYGADGTLRQKVEMQRRIRPIFVLDVYAHRGETPVRALVDRIRRSLDL